LRGNLLGDAVNNIGKLAGVRTVGGAAERYAGGHGAGSVDCGTSASGVGSVFVSAGEGLMVLGLGYEAEFSFSWEDLCESEGQTESMPDDKGFEVNEQKNR